MARARWKVVIAAVVALVLVAALTLVLVHVLGGDDHEERARAARSAGASFDQAYLLAPDDAQRVLWTDWGAVRDELGVSLDARSSAEQVEDLISRGFDADLTTATALGESAGTMQQKLAFSPATLEWELFTQSAAAATLTMRLGGGVSTDDVAAALRQLKYAEPDDPDGVWATTSDISISGQLTPELLFVGLDRDSGLVFASDRVGGVDDARKAAAEADPGAVPSTVVDALGSPVVAITYDATYACSALAMANADPSEQAAGEALVAQAGKVNPLTGFGIAAEPGGGVRVALGFESSTQARTNADTRATLVAGDAPGQGGAFTDRFTVGDVMADGDVVRMDLEPREGEYVISDLSSGPVLFATC
ncbi:hypothetical protein [Nocardioides plantarum]|uniref:Uncharacterized protein n=1 Tax=Nocardioides plantarum TaxID=29299 RepID=A0ABV5K6P5_9ACTN|nr:hypothetical protein [Nocardioides plantarum]